MSSPRTTFGSPMELADDAAIAQALALASWSNPHSSTAALTRSVERDIALTARRWRGADRTTSEDFVPGDVLRIRALTATWFLNLHGRDWTTADGIPASPPTAEREVPLAHLLYAAVPYFLPAGPAIGILGSRPPDESIVGRLQLPYPAVAVYFSRPLEVPDELRGGEERLGTQMRTPTTIRDVLAGDASPDPSDAPTYIRFGTLAAYRRELLSVAGVVLTAQLDGTLDNLVLWILADPVASTTRFHAVEGLLDRSHLQPLVANLAGAVAWGDWTPPERSLPLPEDPTAPAFREALRRGAFRRLEPRGAVAGVRVLDTRSMFQRRSPAAAADRAGGSPAAHLRRAHWQRYRVGPRDDWQYEPKWIPPILVNPGAAGSQRITVYRLPIPPDRVDNAGGASPG